MVNRKNIFLMCPFCSFFIPCLHFNLINSIFSLSFPVPLLNIFPLRDLPVSFHFFIIFPKITCISQNVPVPYYVNPREWRTIFKMYTLFQLLPSFSAWGGTRWSWSGWTGRRTAPRRDQTGIPCPCRHTNLTNKDYWQCTLPVPHQISR